MKKENTRKFVESVRVDKMHGFIDSSRIYQDTFNTLSVRLELNDKGNIYTYVDISGGPKNTTLENYLKCDFGKLG